MKLKTTSIHARIYTFIWKSRSFPNNLCPYFWKMLLAFILFVPVFIIQAPILLAMKVLKRSEFTGTTITDIVAGACVYFFVFCEIEFVKALFGMYSYNQHMANGGLGIFLVAVIVAIAVTINITVKNRKEAEEKAFFDFYRKEGLEEWEILSQWLCRQDNKNTEKKKSEFFQMVKEFIKAKYNQYCPKIDWE